MTAWLIIQPAMAIAAEILRSCCKAAVRDGRPVNKRSERDAEKRALLFQARTVARRAGSRLQGWLAEPEEQLGRRGGRRKGEIDEHFEISGRFETRLLSRREFESIFLRR